MHVKNIIYACEKLVEIYGDFQKGTADIINFFHNQKFEKKEEPKAEEPKAEEAKKE